MSVQQDTSESGSGTVLGLVMVIKRNSVLSGSPESQSIFLDLVDVDCDTDTQGSECCFG